MIKLKKSLKRPLAILLCLLMVISLLPTPEAGAFYTYYDNPPTITAIYDSEDLIRYPTNVQSSSQSVKEEAIEERAEHTRMLFKLPSMTVNFVYTYFYLDVPVSAILANPNSPLLKGSGVTNKAQLYDALIAHHGANIDKKYPGFSGYTAATLPDDFMLEVSFRGYTINVDYGDGINAVEEAYSSFPTTEKVAGETDASTFMRSSYITQHCASEVNTGEHEARWDIAATESDLPNLFGKQADTSVWPDNVYNEVGALDFTEIITLVYLDGNADSIFCPQLNSTDYRDYASNPELLENFGKLGGVSLEYTSATFNDAFGSDAFAEIVLARNYNKSDLAGPSSEPTKDIFPESSLRLDSYAAYRPAGAYVGQTVYTVTLPETYLYTAVKCEHLTGESFRYCPTIVAKSHTLYVGDIIPDISHDFGGKISDNVVVWMDYNDYPDHTPESLRQYRNQYWLGYAHDSAVSPQYYSQPGPVQLWADGGLPSSTFGTAAKVEQVGDYTQTLRTYDAGDYSAETMGDRTIRILADPVSITKTNTCGGKAMPGDTFVWNITVSNRSSTTDHTATVVDTLPAGITVLDAGGGVVSGNTITWSNVSLDKGTSQSFSIKVKVDDNAASGNMINNVTATPAMVGVPPVTATDTVVIGESSQPKTVTSTPSSGTHYSIGEEIEYTITYKNTYSSAQNITITDIIPENTKYVPGSITGTGADDSAITNGTGTLSWTIPNVAVNGSGTVTFRVTVQESAFGTTVTNEGTVNIGDGKTILRTNETETPIVNKKSVVPNGKLLPNGVIEYTIAYEFPLDADSVVITDAIPVDTTYVSGSAKANGADDAAADASVGAGNAGDTLSWTITGTGGDKGVVTFRVKTDSGVASPDIIYNTGNLEYFNGNTSLKDKGDPTNTTEDPISDANKIVDKVSDVNVGDTLTYTIYYSNDTASPENITITDTIPAHTTYVANSAKANGSADADANTSAGAGAAGSTITWVIPNVAAGDSGEVSFEVTINADAYGVTVKNKGEITVGSNNPLITTEAITKVNAKASRVINTKLFAGGEIEYTIGYEFPKDATSLTITDLIPADTTYVAGSISASGDDSAITNGTGTLSWTITGSEGDTGTVTFRVKVVDGTPAGTIIKNKANLEFFDQSSTSLGDDDTNETSDPVDTDIKTVINIPAGGYQIGDEIEYQIDWSYPLASAGTVTITDIVPDGTTFVSGSAMVNGSAPAAGEFAFDSGTKTLTWTLDVTGVDSGSVTFKVKVNDNALGSVIENVGEYKYPGTNGSDVIVKTNKTETPIGAKKSEAVGGLCYAGGKLIYTIAYEFPKDVDTIVITDVIPTDTTYVAGSISANGDDSAITNGTGTLSWTITGSEGDKGTVSFTVLIDASVAAGTIIKNTGKIEYLSNGTPLNPGGTPTNETKDPVEDAVKLVDKDSGVFPGDELTYTIFYSNETGAAADITIVDALPSLVTYVYGSASADGLDLSGISLGKGTIKWVIANVPAGDSGSVEFKVTIDEAALGCVIENITTVDDGTTTITSNPAITIVNAKTSSIVDTKLFAGGEIEYTIGYEFPKDATSLTITDLIPTDTTYVAGSISTNGDDSAITNGTGTLSWTITGSEGDTGTVTFRVKVVDGTPAGTIIKNKANLEFFDQSSSSLGDDDTNETNDPVDTDIKTTTIIGSVHIGDTIPYTIEFENINTVSADIVITDKVPAGTKYVADSVKVYLADGVTEWDPLVAGDYTFSYDEATEVLTWTFEDVAAATIGNVYFEVIVDISALGHEIENQAEIVIGEGDSSISYKTNELVTPVEQIKQSDIDAADGVLLPNGTILFTIGYENNTDKVQTITITDVIPADTTYVAGSISTNGDDSAITDGTGTLTWTIEDVNPGEGGTVTFRVKVDSGVAPGTAIKNKANVTIDGVSTETNETIDIVTPKDVELIHEDQSNQNTTLVNGDTLKYTIVYSNDSMESQDITVSDVIPTGTVLKAIPAGATGYDKDGIVTLVLEDIVRLEWVITNVADGTVDSVTFEVQVTAYSGSVRNTANVTIGDRDPQITNEVRNDFPAPPVIYFTVAYTPNGGTGTDHIVSRIVSGLSHTVLGVTDASIGFTRDGYTFTGWNTSPDGSGTAYSGGASFTVTSNITLYAQWEEAEEPVTPAPTYTVTYNPNGGTGAPIDPNKYVQGATVTVSNGIPTRPGYTFTGWSYGGTLHGGDTFTMPGANVTLVAQWVKDNVIIDPPYSEITLNLSKRLENEDGELVGTGTIFTAQILDSNQNVIATVRLTANGPATVIAGLKSGERYYVRELEGDHFHLRGYDVDGTLIEKDYLIFSSTLSSSNVSGNVYVTVVNVSSEDEIELIDPNPPLISWPDIDPDDNNVVEIEPEEIPRGDGVPTTGDYSDMGLYITLMLISLAVIALIIPKKKREN